MGDARPRSQSESGQSYKAEVQSKIILETLVEVDAELNEVERTVTDSDGNYKQFVNVPGKIVNTLEPGLKSAHGRSIGLRAKIAFDGEDSGKANLNGHTVHFKFTREGDKERKGLNKKQKEGFDKGKDKSEVKTNADGWTPVVNFNLSCYPGDKFEITADVGGKPDGTKKLGPYVVWRKIWFQASYMPGIGADGNDYWDLRSVQEHYNPAFIQLEMAEKKDMGLHIECINEGQHSAGFPNDFFSEQNKKFEHLITHLLFVDKMSKNADMNLNIALNGNGEGKIETTTLLCGAEDGTWLIKNAKYYDESRKEEVINKKWFDEIRLSKTDSAVGATRTIGVKKANKKGSVKLTVFSVDVQNYNAGMAHGHDIYVALGQWKKDYAQKDECKKKVLGTIIHEFGHQLGMVPPKGRSKGKNGEVGKFIQEGGPHCTDKNCVMYMEQRRNDNRPLDFCDACKESLFSMKFEKLISVK